MNGLSPCPTATITTTSITVSEPPTSAKTSQENAIHIPRSIAHSEAAVNRHKRLQKTKLCKYGEDCEYRAIGRCFYAHSIEEVQPRLPKTEEEVVSDSLHKIAAENAETIRNIALQEQAAAMLAANPWYYNPQIAATLAATSMAAGPPAIPRAYAASATAYWAALLGQAATAGELARAVGTTTIPSLMASSAVAATSILDKSEAIPGYGQVPLADFAMLGLPGGGGLLPPAVSAPVTASVNDSSSALLTKPPGLVSHDESPDASSKAPSVDGHGARTSKANDYDAVETQSDFGGTRDLASLGVSMNSM
ncbi:hypothetical protein Pmar_PMAR003344 [Perkinsus marinus ATCC 50983]|uniref:C3H1-type domain-containing protein n=1 Tax=Perkinsus marinus (strain ATCC 50983 / TXsc) TaxID=423536 RepID=C5KH25_PERM5|nr:hypothetical protein Pmar_PMAR003344 [Perkinsus marinus ATCC 50983]EER15887.1 hypothetical protein Pmar_PMAR003344 [Perkinsus marinus ATCC 50983]|eukprot:XP_002784091.1 hypothetical protein Pmar_PMAR003344 [Perkinsus marinus ATCC 50983]